MASIARRCATASLKCMVRCSSRTFSAKGPPPGTMTIGRRAALIIASALLRRPVSARLPPTLTTSGRPPLAARSATAELARGRLGCRTNDFNAAHRAALEFFQRDTDDADAPIGEDAFRDALGERLDEIDVTAARQRNYCINDVGVGRHVGHPVAGAEDILRNPGLDGEAHLLSYALLLGVNPDVAIDDEVSHENGVANLACLG